MNSALTSVAGCVAALGCGDSAPSYPSHVEIVGGSGANNKVSVFDGTGSSKFAADANWSEFDIAATIDHCPLMIVQVSGLAAVDTYAISANSQLADHTAVIGYREEAACGRQVGGLREWVGAGTGTLTVDSVSDKHVTGSLSGVGMKPFGSPGPLGTLELSGRFDAPPTRRP